MASPNEKLAASLEKLENLQNTGRRVFRSKEFTRVHRERLLKNGFLKEIMKGWLISSTPSASPGDTTPWFASFWEFCAAYCSERFGSAWHLSPEQSLLIHAESTVIPKQVIIHALKGGNNNLNLPFDTSFFDLKQKQLPPETDIISHDGLRLLAKPVALIKITGDLFERNPVAAQVVLSGFPDASELLRKLLDGGHSAIAGRLSGAFRHIGRTDIADEILTVMKSAGFDVREADPFTAQQHLPEVHYTAPPIVGRLQAMWASLRDAAAEAFPKPPGLPEDSKAYLRSMDEIYQSDAYHSLSIEGYRVSPALIERVRSGTWDPASHDEDRQSTSALAARGYWQAFQLVKKSVADIIGGADPAALLRSEHQAWYRELFQPGVAAGLTPPSVLAGYRNVPVYLRGSRHVPPRWEAVRDAVPAFFDLLEKETEISVQAVLGHWLFGYIHPYPDGNGRIARFLMNALLASGGYPWTVIRVEDRDDYLSALESAAVDMDIRPFALFIAEQVERSMKQVKLKNE